jgi:hypothetical protein
MLHIKVLIYYNNIIVFISNHISIIPYLRILLILKIRVPIVCD